MVSWLIGIIASYLIYLGESNYNKKDRGLILNILTSFLFYLGLVWIYIGYFHTANTLGLYEKGVLQIGTGLIHFVFLIILIIKKRKKKK